MTGSARWTGLARTAKPVLRRRETVVPAPAAVAFVIGIAAALVAGIGLLLLSGNNPVEVYVRMAESSLGGFTALSRTLLRATPLALTGLAVAIAGSIGLWNIGGEGQMMFGATAATAVAMAAGDLPGPVLVLLMLMVGMAGGALWMAGPAFARSHLGVSEIITTLMLAEVALRGVEWLETGPWRDPAAQGFAAMAELPAQAELPTLFGRAHVGAVIAASALAVIGVALARTVWGYEIRLVGASAAAAQYAGVSVRRKIVGALLLSGAIAGLAGAVELTGNATRFSPSLSGGFGYTGIIIAALALMRPSGVAVAAFVFGAVQVGGQSIQTLGVSSSIATVLQALILLCTLIATVMLNYRIAWVCPIETTAPATTDRDAAHDTTADEQRERTP